MTTPARKPKTPALTVVAKTPPGPDLAALEAFVTEAAAATVAAVTRDSLAQAQMVAGLRVLENDKASLRDQRALAESLFETLIKSFDVAEADLDKAIARFKAGLVPDGAEGQQ